MRAIIMIVGVVFMLAIFAIGVSYAIDVEYAGVYNDALCCIGGDQVGQDNTCAHGYCADSINYVETPSGKVIMTCHFDELIPEDCEVDKLYMQKGFECWIPYQRDDTTWVWLCTLDSVFVKTPEHQAMLRCTADLPPQVGESSETSERVSFCHKGKTIYVDEAAVKAHLKHGDYMGICN